MVFASIFTQFWNDQLVENSQQGLFLILVGFLGSFLFIRMSARLMRSPRVPWWPGSVVSESGVHLHHLVFGIVTMMAAGTFGFTFYNETPALEICALLFGVGAGLTIDEFALWVHLEDVYWAEEGRRSIDATVVAAVVMALLMFGGRPFEVATNDGVAPLIGTIVFATFLFSMSAICFLKERILHGVIGPFFFPISVYGACRLGKPDSIWGRRRYRGRNPRKLAKAEERFSPDRRTERLKEWFRDKVGGGISQH
ncbi:MAG: hypothetical protein JJE10_01040 [Thermoleophilia bacterium]|nr:hypothetical protein [Thermoleophilia bacterium]